MPWVHPFTSVIAGPTGSGKSGFVRRFVHNIKHMMTPIPDRILWCYGEYQILYGTVDGVDFQQGLPDLDTLDPRDKHLIILNDLMDQTDQRVASLFTKRSHHINISVMYIVQNLFHSGKHHRTISLNAHYMVVFKKNQKRIPDHGLGASNIFPKDEILFGSLHCSHCSTLRLFSNRHETRDTGHIETKKSYLSRGETDNVRRYLVIHVYPSLSKINSVLREM